MKIALVAVLLASGCGFTRVEITKPQEPATVEEQTAFVETWRLAGYTNGELTLAGPKRPPTELFTQPWLAVLGNGTTVGDPRDLLPILPLGSDTAELALDWSTRVSYRTGFRLTAVGCLLVSVAGFLTGLGVRSPAIVFSSIGFFFFGPIVSLVLGEALAGDVESARMQAFESYAADLTK